MLGSDDKSLKKAGKALAAGKLVVIPTETVYGLGADAFNPLAVARVFEVKARPSFDPLIVHVASIDGVGRVAADFPRAARRLAEALWPGPLTMVLPKRAELPGIVTSGLDTVGIRFPAHPLARKIIEYSGSAVAAPSANPFGYISPTSARHVEKVLGGKVDFIVDGGPCAVGLESTVLDMTRDIPVLLRPGGMPLERIRDIVGEVLLCSGQNGAPAASPGQLKSHYAPRAPLYLYERGGLAEACARGARAGQAGASAFAAPGRRAAIAFDGGQGRALSATGFFERVVVLSERGDMVEAASRLFALLYELDAEDFDALYAERVQDQGLGRAINDRLYRASKK